MADKPTTFYQTLFQDLAPERLRRNFLQALLEMQGVDRGSLWVETQEGYQCIEAAGAESEKIKGLVLPQDQASIVGWVMQNGMRTMAEVGKDQRHFKKLEEGFSLKSNRILCFPLLLRDGRVYGAVEIIETSESSRPLRPDQESLEHLQHLVDMGAIALSHALAMHEKVSENQRLKQTLDRLRKDEPFICQSPLFAQVMSQARQFARTQFPVLITGESGAGKEIVAREIHRLSPRRDKPFLAQNCSAIPENLLESELFGYKKGAFTGATQDRAGLFEAADGGTVFLDEIGDMPIALQAKILRVLQDGEIKPLGGTQGRTVDVRVLAATNQDLPTAIAERRFREDLFFRLNVLPLRLPPLRQRREDIPLLLNFFLNREARRLGSGAKRLEPKALDLLMEYPWPGNVRELENFVKYLLATVEGALITLGDLPGHLLGAQASARPIAPEAVAGAACAPPSPESGFAGCTYEEVERRYILYLLEKTRWNVTSAAREAAVNRSTFDSRMKKLGIRKR